MTQAEIFTLPQSPGPVPADVPTATELAMAALPNVVATAVAVRPLTDRTLGQHDAQLVVPTYDRRSLTPAVVHFSVGGFHRAHQLLYFDDVA